MLPLSASPGKTTFDVAPGDGLRILTPAAAGALLSDESAEPVEGRLFLTAISVEAASGAWFRYHAPSPSSS